MFDQRTLKHSLNFALAEGNANVVEGTDAQGLQVFIPVAEGRHDDDGYLREFALDVGDQVAVAAVAQAVVAEDRADGSLGENRVTFRERTARDRAHAAETQGFGQAVANRFTRA